MKSDSEIRSGAIFKLSERLKTQPGVTDDVAEKKRGKNGNKNAPFYRHAPGFCHIFELCGMRS